jgi:Cytosine/adenosine deaminases
MTRDEQYMQQALEQAQIAASLGEIPVGAVIVHNDEVIAAAYNTRETEKNAVNHAELVAIDKACRALGGWRLVGCELFVTLEPCPMCAGAVINSRLERVVFGTADPKAGSAGSVCDLFDMPYNHKPEVISGVLAQECSQILVAFFRNLRKRQQ